MGALDGLLAGPRAQGAFLLRLALESPWSLDIRDEAPLTIVAMLRGTAWGMGGTEPVALSTGDLAIIKGPEPYLLADDPSTPPTIVVHPGQVCMTLDGRNLVNEMLLGVRTWGNDVDGDTQILTGIYNFDTEVSKRLLGALPRQMVLRAGDWDSPLLDVLAHEVTQDRPGQEIILDRLLDLLLITAVRTWFDGAAGVAPGWYAAEQDQAIGSTVRMIHREPARHWTVSGLATEAGMSRAAYARRFGEVVGEPPMTYLTNWRLALAADLLREPDATVGDVAGKVGYGSAFALSTAFKRVRGVSPARFRRAHA